jgi:uncharacterized membrane protein
MKRRYTLEAKLTKQEHDILLEIYRQRYEHVRHLQQMRATYFNLYVAVIGFSVAALVSIFNDSRTLLAEAAVLIEGLLWIISILTMMRAERWGGHISHDLRAIREIQNAFASQFESVAQVIPFNPMPLKSFEFNRPLWNRNRSIETPASMLGAVLSAIFIGFTLPLVEWARIFGGAVLVIIPILLWRGDVSNLKRRHAKCCLSESRD